MEFSDFTFLPDVARAIAIDNKMQSLLLRSLDAIRAKAEYVNEFSLSVSLSRSIEAIERRPFVRPAVWALYSELCTAIADDKIGLAHLAAAALYHASVATPARHISNLCDSDLGSGYSSLYARTLDDDFSRPLNLCAVDVDDAECVRLLIGEARCLIGDASPHLLAEMDAVVREIIVVTGSAGANEFSGAATIFLWGAIFINPASASDRVTMAEALTHEAAHALLTGLTGGLDVTDNDRLERYPSPLRDDLRPLEGIAHAAFVLARMTMMLDDLAVSRQVSDFERMQIVQKRSLNAALFRSAIQTLEQHALFTSEGTAIFERCKSYMNAN